MNYGLGDLLSQKTFKTGTVQENVFVHASTGKYVFKYYKTRTADYVKFELRLIEYLNQKNFCCPLIYRNNKGELYDILDDRVVAVYQFVEGEHKTKLNYTLYDQLIRKVAELHLITENLQLEGYQSRWNYGEQFCQDYIGNNLNHKDDKNSDRKKEWLSAEISQLRLVAGLSKGIVHADLDASNILSQGQQVNAIIDFDDANYTFLLFDIVCLLGVKKYKFLGNKYFELIRYVIEKYEEVRPLNELDKMHLFDVLKLSILIDAFWFFDRGVFPNFKEKEKIDRLNELGRDEFYSKMKPKGKS